jgi:hypothetical protein
MPLEFGSMIVRREREADEESERAGDAAALADDILDECVLPDYRGACLSNVMPALMGVTPWADWLPGDRPEAAVVFLFDAMGAHLLDEHRHRAPTLAAMANVTMTTVAPSTTAAALTSFTTGSAPGEHGIVGYRMSLDDGVMNSLRWTIAGADARSLVSSETVQPVPPFAASPVAVVSPAAHAGSGFTLAHLRGANYVGYEDLSDVPNLVADLLASGESLVYVYHDGLDLVGHMAGLGRAFGDELARCDRLVADVRAVCDDRVAIFATADHGMVECERPVSLDAEVATHVDYQSGEARFRWLHARGDSADELLAAAREHHGDFAWVWSRDEVIERDLLGPLGADALRRLGDVALVARGRHCFADPDDATPAELIGRHGGLTADEMLVPLLRG